jgi:type I restriction enzyme R subunit
MQTIARANRIYEGKNNGLIVDYIETYTSLLDALAIYGTGNKVTGTTGGIEPPVKPKEELIKQLEETLKNTEKFLSEEVNFDINILINSSGLAKIAAMDKAINAVYTNDETKYKFQLLAREVFKKYKALMPDTLLYVYAPRKNAIDVIYTAIEDNIESADVSEIMNKIQNVVDESIENMVKEPTEDKGKIIDLSGLDFELIEKYFLKTPNKNAVVQSLKNKIEKQLKRMVEQNPFRVDFYQYYQEIIDEYNRGKDTVTIEETFKKIIEFVNSLSEEEARVKREGLTDEQAAIFDILRKSTLNEKEKKMVKEIAVELLAELKKDKLKVEQWSEKTVTASAVFNTVNNTLFNRLPFPTYQIDDIDLRVTMIYDHLQQQYYGGGVSIYGPY